MCACFLLQLVRRVRGRIPPFWLAMAPLTGRPGLAKVPMRQCVHEL